ncbi:phage holin family protein [Bacteroides heparinolyticus]|uniref:phage holin family protein n=1 Tax=Prevotella heparinolytica TaxID=28113 RepID=UPI00359F1BE3
MNDLKMTIAAKFAQLLISIITGLLVRIETAINFFVPCLCAIILDVITAYLLGRRMHKKYPEKADGLFKSEYKCRIIFTLIIVFIAIILGAYVDMLIVKNGDIAVRFVMAVFLFYELWSCLENWSSENDAPIARALQRIMVNKAERHLNVPLKDILTPGDNGGSEKGDDNGEC